MSLTNQTAFVHQGLPSYMRAQLAAASRPGSRGYDAAGYVLGCHLEHECPANCELDQWDDELVALRSIIDDDQQLTQWLRMTFPRILGRVPDRRIDLFLAGLRRGHAES